MPLGVLEPVDVVDGVVEVDVDVVRAEAPQALLEGAHHGVPVVARARVGLRREVDAVALAAQGLPHGRLRVAAPIAVGDVEVVDAAIEGMPDEVALAGAEPASPEGDVGDLHARAPERHVALHLGPGPRRRLSGCAQRRQAHAEPRQRPSLQELATAESIILVRGGHGTTLRWCSRGRRWAKSYGPDRR